MSPASRPKRPLVRVVGGLAALNLTTTAVTFISSPLQAQALGPTGRGDLAAILVPLAMVPLMLGLNVAAYVTMETARTKRPALPFWSTSAITAVLALVLLGLAPVLANVFAEGRPVVERYVLIGLLLSPTALFAQLLIGVNLGLERWWAVQVTRTVTMGGVALASVVLFALDALTVESVAIASIAFGLLSLLPLLPATRVLRPIRAEARAMREGLVYGARNHVGSLAAQLNARLDQLIMIPLVPADELGLYAVAVTISGLSGLVIGILGPMLFVRVAGGDREMAPRAVRVSILSAAVIACALAAVTPLMLPLLFGEDFRGAVGMTLVLLVASLPLAGVAALGSVLMGMNRPGTPSIGELVALAITIPGLLVLLPPLGGFGAAIVSLLAYSANFAVLVRMAAREAGEGVGAFIVVRRSDVRWLWGAIRQAAPGAGRR